MHVRIYKILKIYIYNMHVRIYNILNIYIYIYIIQFYMTCGVCLSNDLQLGQWNLITLFLPWSSSTSDCIKVKFLKQSL